MGNKAAKQSAAQAAAARADEEARQARIREGTRDINAIFDGGTVATGRLTAGAAFDPTKTYYRADGTVWTPPESLTRPASAPPSPASRQTPRDFNSGFGRKPDPTPAPRDAPTGLFGVLGRAFSASQADPWQTTLSEGLFSGVEQREGFDDDFFSGLRGSFVNYARPQLDDQMDDARKQLTFALARSGNLDSSTRGEQSADLQRTYDLNLQDIADRGRQYETDSRNSIEQARSDLIAQLQLTGDNTGAANAALARAKALATPPAFSPIGQLFQDATAMLSQQAAFERAYSAGIGPKPRFTTGLFGTSPSAVKVGGR